MDNIDFTGKELTRKMDDASRASASFSLDGNGYWVGNLYMEDTNTRDKAGIFGDVYASGKRTVLQNIAFIGIRNHGLGGLFVNLQNADLTDMYIEVEAHNFLGGGIGYSTDNVKLTNVVLHTTYVNKAGGALTTDSDGDYTSALGNKFGAVSISAAGAEDTNVYAISNAAYVYGGGQKNPANLFASAAEMREEVNTVPAGFNTEYWTADHGILIFKSVQDTLLPSMALNITAQTETVNLLDPFTFAADRDVEWSVSGLESGEYTLEGGMLTITAESAVGKTFTVTATYIHPQYGIAVTAQTGSISVQNEKEQASEDLGEFAFAKNRAVTDPVEVTLAEGERVRSLLDGETPAETPQAQDGKVVFGTDFFAAQASGMHTYTLQVESMTKVTSYTFPVYLLDFKIGTTDEFEEFAAAVKEAGEGVILAELDDNLDYTGKTFTAFGSAVKHAYTLDGKGHYINGISSPSDGIFGNISTGQVNGRVTLRNIAITNISNPGDPAGLFSNGYNVELCDVFISYATVMGNNFTAPAVFAPINATLKNVVVVAQVDPSKDIGAISKAGETATTQYINCYAVSNATYLYPDAPDTNTLFADVAAMKAAVTGVPEGFNTEYWTQAASGLLTFKSVDALYDVTNTLQMTQTAVTAEERTEVTISFGMSFTAEAGTLADPFAINQHQNFNYAGDSLMNYILIGDGQTQRSAYEICTDNANDITSYKPGAGWMSMGGIWAPVLVQVPADGSGIKVSVYTGYLAEGAFTVMLKAGWSWNTANGMTMRVTEDVTFGWQNGQFERI